MAEQFAAPPINPLISVQPLSTASAQRDAAGVPAQLANTPPGSVVEGFVINRDAQNNPILRTPLGDLLIKSDVFIRTGSEVVFRVDTSQQGHARILTIDGLPPQDYAATQSRGMRADTIATGSLPQASQTTAPIGFGARAAATTLQAVLVSTTPLPAATIAQNPLLAATVSASNPIPAGLLKLQQGAQLEVKLLQISLPEQLSLRDPIITPRPAELSKPQPAFSTSTSGGPAQAPTTQPGTPLEAAQTMANAQTARTALNHPQAATATQLTSAPSAPLHANTSNHSPDPVPSLPASAMPLPSKTYAATPDKAQLPERSASALANASADQPARAILQPSSNSPASASATPQKSAATGIPAQVIGHEKDGALILQSAVGTLKMHSAQKLPVGTAVRLELTLASSSSDHRPTAMRTTLPQEMQPLTHLARGWPALEETLGLMQTADPAIARMIAQQIPEIGPRLASGLLFFIAAVKGGEIRQWLGQRAVSVLDTKAPDLLGRLNRDMLQLQQMLMHSPLDQWSGVMVPMLYQGQIEHARLYFRDDGQQGKDGRKPDGQRFILEVDLNPMGEMQFDGFVRQAGKTRQFDLILRSERALPNELAQQIRTSFETTMEVSGIKGYLAFQSGQLHFVRPLASKPGSAAPEGAQPILA